MRINVPHAVTKLLSPCIMAITQMHRNLTRSTRTHIRNRAVNRVIRRIRLRRERTINHRLRQDNTRLRHAHQRHRLRRSRRHLQRLRISQANILTRQNHDATRHKTRILAALQHARQVVHRGVRVRAAHGLNERTHHVIMLITRTVVADRGAVHRLRSMRQGDAHGRGRFRRLLPRLPRRVCQICQILGGAGRFCRSLFGLAKGNRSRRLQGGQGAAGVASGNRREVGARIRINNRRTIKTARVSQRTVNQTLNIGLLQRMNPQQQRAREQRRNNAERRVLRRSRHQNHPAVLHTGQERILLSLRETVNLVEEQHGGRAVHVAVEQRLIHDRAHILHARSNRRKLHELTTRRARNHMRQSGLTRTRRAVQNHRGRASRAGILPRQHAQRRTRSQQMLLAENLINSARTHTHRQRRTRRRTRRIRTRGRGTRGGLLSGRTDQAHTVPVIGQLKIKEGISHSLTLSFHNLEAGTGCGYTAADLARGVTPHGFSIG